jgi:hypothetical protein
VTNTLYDMPVQAETWLVSADDELLDMVKRWTIAFSRSMQVHLREDGDLEAELKVRFFQGLGCGVCFTWSLSCQVRLKDLSNTLLTDLW